MKVINESFEVRTSQRCEMIDITAKITAFITQAGITTGDALIYCPHTTAGITINENADQVLSATY